MEVTLETVPRGLFSVTLLDRLNISPYKNLASIDRGLWWRSSRAVYQNTAQGFGKRSDIRDDDFNCRPGMLRTNGKSSTNEGTILQNKAVSCVAEHFWYIY